MKRYALGLDFGTLDGRALLVDLETGEERASCVYAYDHGVIDRTLPESGEVLPDDWALQDPSDYLRLLENAIPAVLESAGISGDQVIGIGVDFTSCTILPIDEKGMPLCMDPEWRKNPHSWVKLWKHHAAEPYANRLREVALARGEQFLFRYGGKVSSEWMIPKVWQVLEEAPQVYRKAHRFIEAGDWMVLQMSGREMRSSCNAGYKAIWDKGEGYPSPEFFASLNPELKDVVSEKLSSSIYSPGTPAGGLTSEIAKLTGLKEGTPVAVGIIDAHAAVPGCSVTEPGKMVMIMGTSTCHMLLSSEGKAIPGIPGVVEDGILPGFFGYEAGQAAVGDSFNWFVSNCIPGSYEKEAMEREMDIYSLLEEKATGLKPGGKGLIALDWWNGNRSVLNNADLSGLILGLTLNTRPEDIFRALLESTAYGTRMIIETFEEHGIPINELYACGGMPHKDRLMMQIYADVTGRDIRVASSRQASALGAAMLGSLAAGENGGGFDSITEAVKVMASPEEYVYSPVEENVRTYDLLYAEFRKLHDHFGRGENPVMEFLKRYKG